MRRSEIKKIPLKMIKIEDLKDKEIIIFGVSRAKDILMKMMKDISYDLIAYCDNNKALWGNKIGDVLVYSPNKLKEYVDLHRNSIIIIASAFEHEIFPQLREELKIKNKIILTDQLFSSGFQHLLQMKMRDNAKPKKEIIKEMCSHAFLIDTITITKNIKELAVYSAPKVGNTTINAGLGYKFRAHTEFFHFHSMSRPQFTKEQKKQCASKVKKIITGVRDAIAQNLSLIYQFPYFHCMVLGNDGYDAQKVFTYYAMESIIHEKERRTEGTYGYQLEHRTPFLIQSWFDDTLKVEFGIDLYQYPFDKEKGYSIYKIGRYEVLVYQMEKMDMFYDIFREFIGNPNLEFKKENDGGLKWYKESYLELKKNVALEKEYVEKTYSGKMMQHFYSKEDIEKFWEKWKKNIIED